MTRQTVVFTGNDRPHYMRETLESWSRARGVGNWLLGFHLEPGCPEVAETCRSVGFAPVTVTVNPERYGVQRNPYEAISGGFASGAEFVVLAEDDMIVSTDVLEYLAWARDAYMGDRQVLAVCAHMDYERPGGLSAAVRLAWFGGWVWGTWRDRWEHLIAPDWTFGYEHGGWDWRLTDHWMGERGYRAICPALSRSQHIGKHGGTHCSPEQFAGLQSQCFVPDVPPQRYQETGKET